MQCDISAVSFPPRAWTRAGLSVDVAKREIGQCLPSLITDSNLKSESAAKGSCRSCECGARVAVELLVRRHRLLRADEVHPRVEVAKAGFLKRIAIGFIGLCV